MNLQQGWCAVRLEATAAGFYHGENMFGFGSGHVLSWSDIAYKVYIWLRIIFVEDNKIENIRITHMLMFIMYTFSFVRNRDVKTYGKESGFLLPECELIETVLRDGRCVYNLYKYQIYD